MSLEKEKAAFTGLNSESGKGKHLFADASIPETGENVKYHPRLEAKAERLYQLIIDALLDIPMEPGGSSCFCGGETQGSRRTRRYCCLVWEEPMTLDARNRLTNALRSAVEAVGGEFSVNN